MSRLTPCPNKPCCVSSLADPGDTVHHIAPLRLPGGGMPAVKAALLAMPRTHLAAETPSYVHVVFTTALLRFQDDVELDLDADGQTLHVRSASRVGYSDLGTNRRRVEAIRAALTP